MGFIPILGDPGATSRDDAIFSGGRPTFSGESFFQVRTSPWALILTKPVPESKCSNSARRSSRGTLSPSYTKWFSSSSAIVAWPGKILVESFRKKDSTKPRKSQTVTWAPGNNIRRSIFTADLSKVYRKYISLMHTISTSVVFLYIYS